MLLVFLLYLFQIFMGSWVFFALFFSVLVRAAWCHVFIGIMLRCVRILSNCFPFPGSVFSCVTCGPIIRHPLCPFCSCFPSCPFASVHHIGMCLFGISVNVWCTCPQCSFCSIFFFPECVAYVHRIVSGVCFWTL